MKLKEQIRAHVLRREYSQNTFLSYWHWIEEFLRFSKVGTAWVHPAEMGKEEVEQFLTHLAVRQNVSPNV